MSASQHWASPKNVRGLPDAGKERLFMSVEEYKYTTTPAAFTAETEPL